MNIMTDPFKGLLIDKECHTDKETINCRLDRTVCTSQPSEWMETIS